MKKYIGLVIGIIAVLQLSAQEANEAQKGFQKENLFVGGNFGLSFGDYTLINISPQLGYRFNPYLAAGIGVNGQYVSIKDRFNGNAYSKTSQGVMGFNVFGRVYPIQRIMLQLQPEVNYLFGKRINYGPPREEHSIDATIAPSLLAGAGLVFPSGRGAFIISAFYDVLQNENSPYGKKPIINFTYNFGL